CVYDVTGPEPLDAAGLADLYAQIGGKPVESVSLDDDSFVAGLVGEAGGDDHLRYGAELGASFGRSIRGRHLAGCTDTRAPLSGRPPRGLHGVLDAHRDELTASRSTV